MSVIAIVCLEQTDKRKSKWKLLQTYIRKKILSVRAPGSGQTRRRDEDKDQTQSSTEQDQDQVGAQD